MLRRRVDEVDQGECQPRPRPAQQIAAQQVQRQRGQTQRRRLQHHQCVGRLVDAIQQGQRQLQQHRPIIEVMLHQRKNRGLKKAAMQCVPDHLLIASHVEALAQRGQLDAGQQREAQNIADNRHNQGVWCVACQSAR